MVAWRRLLLLSVLFSGLLAPSASSTPVFFEFDGQVRAGNLTSVAPIVLNLSEGDWPVELSVGNVTLVLNVSVGDAPLVVEINESLLRRSLGGFSTATVFLSGREVPSIESEKTPCMAAPDWSEGEGESSARGPSRPVPMETVLFSPCREREYLLLPSGVPVVAEYGGVKKYCLIRISEGGGGWSSQGGCSFAYIENAVSSVPVEITSRPCNATVYINGFHLFGEWFTPMVVHLPLTPELSPYNVSIGARGYPFVSGVVNSTEKRVALYADLSALSRVVLVHSGAGVLEVLTEPANASLKIFAGNNEVFSGRSPIKLVLPEGVYTLSASLPGYGGIVENVTVPANESVSLDLTLSLLPANLRITTVPSGAEVRIGNVTCTSPCSLNLTAGVYNVSASLPRYLPSSVLVGLAPGESQAISLELVQMPVLRILTSPEGATVTVGGEQCFTPCNITLAPGSYSVTVEKSGYEKAVLVVSLNAGDVSVVNVSLRKEPLPTSPSPVDALKTSHEVNKVTETVSRQEGINWKPALVVFSLLALVVVFAKMRG
ncbi:hypothetical protein TEU_03065 [Thermococcus eurythermalis]|uniref:PEGA domain-containing protein n=2 Tax=Thermococcus eurythermalis TaxID=1505907 RepID=A0A097QSD8_9EURY|nr:hypothetical protein TEU_03065 [Thermococcus eurythermalis]